MANYSKANEVIVSGTEAVTMMNDNNLIVVMAIPDTAEDTIAITYWSKDDGMLPPWIVMKQAA